MNSEQISGGLVQLAAASPFGPVGNGLREAAELIDAQHEVIAMVRALHHPNHRSASDDAEWCEACAFTWPCPTARVVAITDPKDPT